VVTNPTREEVLSLFGETTLAVQELEEAMAGLIGAHRELVILGDDPLSDDAGDRLEAAWRDVFNLTAGKLRTELRLDGALGQQLEDAVDARNLLVHHYLRDRSAALDSDAERAAMATSLGEALERFRAVRAGLDVERLSAMHDAKLDDDYVTSPGEARRIRYYDPELDESVPPDLFASN
jgi:hypothetical protein